VRELGPLREAPDGSVDYFFDRWNCRSPKSYDVHKITDPAP
jgi:hypothetical protein